MFPWLRNLWSGLNLVWKIVIGLGALAAAIVAIAGAVALIHGEDQLPPRLAGKITTLELSKRQTLRNYCRDTYTGAKLQKCLDQPFVEELGFVFYVRVELVGYEGPCCELRYTLLDSQLQEIPGFVGITAVANVTPDGIDDQGGWSIWVGKPPKPRFSARFDLNRVDGSMLDSRSVPV
jgi:hypothetical protein